VHARVVAAAAALVVLAALCAAPPASAAPAAPTGLTPGIGDTVDATPVLSWDRVPDATAYEVDISAAADFSTKLVSTIGTVNRRVTPTIQMPMSDLYWRVRAKSSTGTSDWAIASFSRSRLAGPVLRAPSDGELLDQPSEPVVFRWDPVPGAIGYTVEVDRGPDVDWIGAITGTTRTTTSTPIAIASGDWAWRVIATMASGQLTFPSMSRTFTLGDLDPVVVTSPADGQDLEDVVLDWAPVPGALRYELRVSTDDEFASTNIVDARTVKGTRYSPPTTYDVDDYWWQVRAIDPLSVAVPWSAVPIHSFTRTWDPLATTPGHGTDPNPVPDLDGAPRLVFPPNTLAPAVTGDMYFQWTPVRHATAYRLDVGTDESFSPGTFSSCTTPLTTFTPERMGANQCLLGLNTSLYWRVKAVDGPANVQGYYSPIGRYRYARQQVHQVAPADNELVDLPSLRWDPIAGAERYAVSVESHTGDSYETTTYSTSWTVPDKLDPASGPFEWTVQAIGNDGTATPLTIGARRTFRLTGNVPETAAGPLTPLAQGAAPTDRFPALRWEPLDGAATYRLWVGTAGTNSFHPVDGAFAYPAATDNGKLNIAGGDYEWFVQAFDEDEHLIGQIDDRGAFTVTSPATVTGHQVAIKGSSLDSGSTCTYSLLDTPGRICPTTAGTPVLDWQPNAGVAYYLVYVSRDRNFQNMVYGSYSDSSALPRTVNTRWTRAATLPESQAGTAYYWYIRPCKAQGVCAADPLQANHAFEKRSPQVITDPVLETSNDITFSWRDYLATNQAAAPHAVTGERSDQEARTYQLQVSLTVGFDRVIDDVVVDQTTYTAYSRLYPEGNLYWRVRAYDGDNRALPWSDTLMVAKGSPRPSPIAPIGVLSTTDAFRWTASPFAVSYDVQVYKQADTTASPVNKVIDESVSVAALAPLTPLPAGTDYVWRVRGVDDSGNPGGWSDWAAYRIEGAAPILELPVADGRLPTADGLYTWHAVPAAATYRLERRELTGAVKETVTTAALAWAPTAKIPAGAWQWRVTALDTGGAAIASSAWRNLTVQAGPTATTLPVVTGSGSVGELLHGSNPVWDVPDVVATYQWLRNGSPIAGATGVDYEVVTADVGRSISLRVTGNVAGYDTATVVSNAVTGVLGATTTAVTPPSINGSGRVGTTLGATLPEWDQAGIATTYRWLRDGVLASSGTLSYTVRDSDLGKTMTFQVTGKKAGYGDAVVTTPGVVVTAGPAPSPSVPPTITGQPPKVGQRLGVQTGTWGTGFRYAVQWLRDGTPLPGAVTTSYTPVPADATHALSVLVTATRAGYESGSATTAAVPIPRMASTTTLTLPTATLETRAGRKAKVKATVTVTVAGWPTPSGQVRVLDGKKAVAKAKLKKDGTVTLKLKGLKKGKHKLVATYDGTTAAARSTSAKFVLKVV
jgi:hypothetical protein